MAGLLLVVFINFVGIGALIPILPFTVVDQLGYTESVMTLLLACFSLAMFIGNPILGRLSDKLGRKRILIASISVATAAHFWFAISEDITILFISRILAGFGAGNIGVIQAIIADNSERQDRARMMGLMGACIGAGFVLGPALGGLLAGIGNGPAHQMPFLVAGLFSALSLVMAFRLPESYPANADMVHAKTSFFARVAALISGPLGLFAAAFFLLNLSFAQVEAAYVLVVRDLLGFGSRETGWLFAYIGICIIIVQGGIIGRVVPRFGEMRVIRAGIYCLIIGQIVTVMLATIFADGGTLLIHIMVATSFVCIGFALTNPTLSAASSAASRRDEMGGALGLVQGFGSLGQVIGLTAAGPLYLSGGGGLSFGFAALISVCLLLTVFFIARMWLKLSSAAAA